MHILVVDDDDVRQVVADMLLDVGFRVSLADSGKAMLAFLETPDAVDLIVLDASTAGEQGVGLARERGIRLVMISGNPNRMKAFHDRADQLLWKPFRQEELIRAIEHALDSETRGQRSEDPI